MTNPRDIFARCQLRCTKQRRDVYDVLAECRCHPTAEQLHRMVNERSPGTSLATVYNTLEAFCKAGLCRKIATSEGGARYDPNTHEHMHMQLDDGRVIDVPEEMSEQIMAQLPAEVIRQLEEMHGVSVKYLSVQIFAEAN